jgi:hypothetical protein
MVASALVCVMFIIRVTPRSQGPRMLPSVTRAKSSPKQPTTTCIQYAWAPPNSRGPPCRGVCKSLVYATGSGNHTCCFMTKTCFVPMVTVKMHSLLRPHCFSYVGKDFCELLFKTGKFYMCLTFRGPCIVMYSYNESQ